MEDDFSAAGFILLAILRIGSIVYCYNRAGKLNRSETAWGIFAFAFPIIALISIHLVKPRRVWTKDPSMD